MLSGVRIVGEIISFGLRSKNMAKERKPRGYWTKEKCYELAQDCKSRWDFCNKYKSAYNTASNNGWLDELFGISNYKKWNYDKCYEIAKDCKSRSEFKEKCESAYKYSYRNGLLDEWFGKSKNSSKNPRIAWTKEKCYEIAKDCKSRGEFYGINKGAYNASLRNGWINEWFEKKEFTSQNYKIYAIEDYENKVVYVGLTYRKLCDRDYEHRNGTYSINKKRFDVVNRYFKSIGKEMPDSRLKMDGLNSEDAQYYEDWYKQRYAETGWRVLNIAKTGIGKSSLGQAAVKWNKKTCYEESKKYKSRRAFRNGNRGAYNASLRNGWLDEWFGETKNTLVPLSKEKCYEIAKGYSSRGELYINNRRAYRCLHKNGLLNELFDKKRKKWTKEKCYEIAKDCKSRIEFKKMNDYAYQTSRINGWLDEFFPKKAA